ncbi:MAG: septal ring lytic transglycosylase RlpA family lipoprotein [Gammaproteobacteria bacterium]|nr:MAG: septal ring lytic transglycosylase RlpA family lipoprotein [Gammaproteobacteria bacterium]
MIAFYRHSLDRMARLIQPSGKLSSVLLILSTTLLVQACLFTPPNTDPQSTRYSVEQDGPPSIPFDPQNIKPAQPQWEPPSKYGNHSPYTVLGKTYQLMESVDQYQETGIASWYGSKFQGHRTSSWEPYDMLKMTAAHKTLPLPSYVKVTNLENGITVTVRVNDRGPFHDERVIDLSYAAAHQLGITEKGTAQVKVEIVPLFPPPNAEKIQAAFQNQNASPATRANNGQLYLQVGAYKDLNTALDMQSQLIPLTETPVSISRITSSNKVLHRVQIGPFNQWQDLETLTTLIKAKNIANPVVRNW